MGSQKAASRPRRSRHSGKRTQTHYDHAPIIEAVIDFRIEPGPGTKIENIEAARNALKSRYPIAAPIRAKELEIAVGEGAPTVSTSDVPLGTRVSTEKNDRIVQMRTNGFTFSHMPPYTEWATLRDESKKAWQTYLATVAPKYVVRVATRIINRIEIPVGRIEIEDYFNLHPTIPKKGIPQDVAGMFFQLKMPQPDLEATAIINFAMPHDANPDRLSFILDFDIMKDIKLEPQADEIWSLMERFHDRRNDLFEACITDKVRALIK